MNFEDQITKSLEDLNLNEKQRCQFSWLCGLRVLPFLSVQRGFTYWQESERQKYLYSIFNALDLGAQAAFIDNSKFGLNSDVAATASATDNLVVANVAYAANAANASNAAEAARNAVGAVNAAKNKVLNLEDLLNKDIITIKEKGLKVCNHDISVYGKLWDDFQEDLKSIGCAYWARFYEKLFIKGFDIDKTQLERHIGIPDEVKANGADATGRYLEGLGDNIERLNEARIIILGEKGAGKTSLTRKLLDIEAEMPKDHESTEGVEMHLWDFPDKDGIKSVNAYIWDFAGHSITHSAHRCFMSARCLYIYVYNGRIERDNDPSYWLEQIRIHGGDSPMLFLINEKDYHKADIAEKKLKKEYPSIAGYYRVDIGAEDTVKLENFRQTVMNMVRNNPSWNNQIVSAEAYKIKSKLRELFSKIKPPHITRDQFDKIAKSCGACDERIEEILEDLHTLGICLWYNNEEMEDFNTLVLNPDWITNGIYRIITQGFNKHEYILTLEKGTEIIKNDKRYEYPRDKVAFLFKLMKVYELAFFKNNDCIFIPGILPLDIPDKLPELDNANERLTMCFVVEKVLPPNIASRIIVQRSNDIFDENLLWREGAVLKYRDGDAVAFVFEDVRRITVRVTGNDKTAYIASIRETIKAIFDSYQVIKPDLEYEVLIPEEIKISDSTMISNEQHNPLMLPENTIRDFLKGDQDYPYHNMRIPLDRTAQGYGIGLSTDEVTEAFRKGVQKDIAENKKKGLPIARYDAEKGRAYLENADGTREYV
jgi:GTPase SAR1 family protein